MNGLVASRAVIDLQQGKVSFQNGVWIDEYNQDEVLQRMFVLNISKVDLMPYNQLPPNISIAVAEMFDKGQSQHIFITSAKYPGAMAMYYEEED